jgi:hypothetical protein
MEIKSPYPLMKYSIATDKWTTIKDLESVATD